MDLTPIKSHYLKWGLIMGVCLSAYGIILGSLNMAGNETMGYVSYLFIIGCIVMGLKEYRDENEGFMTFGKGFGLGTLASLVGGAISSVLMYAYMAFINTGYIEQIREVALEKITENPDMPEEEMEMAVSMMETFTTPAMITVMGIVGTAIVGIIISLIASAIMKKDPPVTMGEEF